METYEVWIGPGYGMPGTLTSGLSFDQAQRMVWAAVLPKGWLVEYRNSVTRQVVGSRHA